MDSDVDKIWEDLQKSVITAANKTLGRTKGTKKIDRETWWWTETVQTAIQLKKTAFKNWQTTQTPEDRETYKTEKKNTKKVIAVEQANSQKNLYKTLCSKEGQKHIHKLARQRCRSTKDPATCKSIKSSNGDLLYKDRDIITAWFQYYKQLLNPNPTATKLPDMNKNLGLIPPIHPNEVKMALQKMSNKKSHRTGWYPSRSLEMLARKRSQLAHQFLQLCDVLL
ncbi:uncharacterized protein LOC124542444 [Vanessa cardui]|uniref:uncharacterized protein LOC124542444 n=1 Tax=Vanessa cardui TaxID=171605 RepID=UPI001F145271|nr:uncharacterized protein LOC124542444 [Vanessa cardui]